MSIDKSLFDDEHDNNIDLNNVDHNLVNKHDQHKHIDNEHDDNWRGSDSMTPRLETARPSWSSGQSWRWRRRRR